MRAKDLKWSKTRAQCPHCHGWYTRQGIFGHIRFRHPSNKREESDPVEETLEDTYRDDVYIKALAMFKNQGRLTPALRDYLLDCMLLDYLRSLEKQSK